MSNANIFKLVDWLSIELTNIENLLKFEQYLIYYSESASLENINVIYSVSSLAINS